MTENGSDSLPFEPPEQENIRLREENARLRRLLAVHSIPIPQLAPEKPPPNKTVEPAPSIDKEERARRRIALFRGLFRGREDVYARRWENDDGRHGYGPAHVKDWKAINKSRPEDRKKVAQKTRKFLPMTDAVIEQHLLGQETIGVYPLLPDETCWFLAADFDKKTWEYDALAFLETCTELNVPAALERSRSGKGGHIWIFFDRAISAITARKLACVLLTRTMERRHQVGLDSYDRFFPNQDTMPKGGFGNLIALPLQFAPRKLGNSVFIDADFNPYPDQWQFLSTIRRMACDAAEDRVAEAQRKGDLIGVRMSISDDEGAQDPWTLPPSRKRRERPIEGPLPKTVRITRANLVYVEKKDLPPAMLNRLLRLAAFQNPEFYKAQAMRLPTYNKPRVIACGQEFPQHIAVPRGCLTETLALLESHKIRPEVRDERFAGMPIEAEFRGQLRPFQEEAVAKITRHDEGILCAPTAFGKTAVAAWLIAKRKVNTLVVVHRQQLLDQWQERLGMFLDLPAKAIGHVGGGKMDRTGCVDVAVIQSLYRQDEVKDFVAEYGQVIVDECHHISAFTFEQVMRQVKAKFVVGLTATPTRKDGHHPIIYMQCGPVRFSMSARTMTETTPFEHKVTSRYTEFRMTPELTEITIQDIYAALVDDVSRNEMIANDIVRAVEAGRCPLLLTGRTEHLQFFATRLASIARHVFVLKGGMGKKQRRETSAALASVPEDESRVLLATGSYIGEGFDDARLDTLFLAMPISWKNTLQQYVGRLHRLHDNKRFVQVYDYVDHYIPMLSRMYERRLKGYSTIGMTETTNPAVLVAVIFAHALCAQTEVQRTPQTLAQFSASIEDLARAASPAVVQISVRGRAPLEEAGLQQAGFIANQRATGSGVIVDPNGYIVTNAHVIIDARHVDVSVIQPAPPGEPAKHKHFAATTVGLDRETDLAVLKIEATGLPTLPFLDDSQSLKQGQLVLALGSPLGLDNSLTVGFVSAPNRHLSPDKPNFYVQTDTPINPGNSGGPLLDIAGHIAGINTMIMSQSGGSEGIGFAIPSNVVRRTYLGLRQDGFIRRGAIGVLPQDITPTLAAALGLARDSGIILSDIVPSGPAEAAGMEPGDIVLAVDGKPIEHSSELMAAVFQHRSGEEIMLDVQRGTQRLKKTVAVLARTKSPEDLDELAIRDAQLVRRLGVLALTLDEKVTPLLPDLRRLSGVAVVGVPAEFVGLNPGLIAGDVIYELNGSRIATLDALRAALDRKAAGDPVALLVERSGQLIYVALELE